MIARLNHELAQRKALCLEQEQLQGRKAQLHESNEEKSNFLAGLLSKLKGVEEATMPVAKALGSLMTNFNYIAIWFYVAMSLGVYGLFSGCLQ